MKLATSNRDSAHMDLRQLTGLDSSLRLTGTPALTRAWGVGQILQATVVEQTARETFTLRAGTTTFEARSALSLQTGQRLQLQVVNTGEQTVLRVLTPSTAGEPALTQALRAALPRQTDLAPALQQLTQSAAQFSNPQSPTSAMLRQIFTHLVAQLPQTAALTQAPRLKQAIVDCGVLLEAKLAQEPKVAAERIAPDFKANLLRLADALKAHSGSTPNTATPPASSTGPAASAPTLPANALADLARHVEGALARVQTNQIQSVQGDTGTPLPLVVEIPVRETTGYGAVKLRIERDAQAAGADPDEQPWSMWIELDPPGIGRLRARVSTLDRNASVTFWSEQPETVALVNANVDALAQGLRAAGLECGDLACLAARGPVDPLAHARASGLLDEHA